MEHCPAKLKTSAQLYPESMSDMKSRFWQINNQSLSRTEVICPQPRHASRVSFVIDSASRFGSKPKGHSGLTSIHSILRPSQIRACFVPSSLFRLFLMVFVGSARLFSSCASILELSGNSPASRGNISLPMYRGDCGLEILDINLSTDDLEWDLDGGSPASFFCGSPPVRTNNPIVHDAQFAKQTHAVASPLGCSLGMKPRVDRGSPSCGSTFVGSPKVRIEGFACGKSESRCAVPALA